MTLISLARLSGSPCAKMVCARRLTFLMYTVYIHDGSAAGAIITPKAKRAERGDVLIQTLVAFCSRARSHAARAAALPAELLVHVGFAGLETLVLPAGAWTGALIGVTGVKSGWPRASFLMSLNKQKQQQTGAQRHKGSGGTSASGVTGAAADAWHVPCRFDEAQYIRSGMPSESPTTRPRSLVESPSGGGGGPSHGVGRSEVRLLPTEPKKRTV